MNKSTENAVKILSQEFLKNNKIDPENYEKYEVKRGLRNKNGTGVMAGLTLICEVEGYKVEDGVKIPAEGKLFYRGIDVAEIIDSCIKEDRFGFEEVAWLLLFGELPTEKQLDFFKEIVEDFRELPYGFAEDMILKAPSPNIMNKLARSILALYSYDEFPEDYSLDNIMRQAMMVISRAPTIVVNAYQIKRWTYDNRSMYFHRPKPKQSISEAFLRMLRGNKKYTNEEAKLLDICLILQADHGGGNNSTFTTRVISSSETDTFSALSAAVGSLKGHRHGGANIKVNEMMDYIKAGVKNPKDEAEVLSFLEKIVRKEEGDKSGLIYGMGHAVYTKSDPRSGILYNAAYKLAEEKEVLDDLLLIKLVEKLAPQALANVKGDGKDICANVDLYSGFVYKLLGIPTDLFTPLFAIARMPGWCAHRIEEVMTGGRIMRPAYKFLGEKRNYKKIEQRG